jgi:hypothetical protein
LQQFVDLHGTPGSPREIDLIDWPAHPRRPDIFAPDRTGDRVDGLSRRRREFGVGWSP